MRGDRGEKARDGRVDRGKRERVRAKAVKAGATWLDPG